MPYCSPCERYFSNYHALDQHIDDSPAHNFDCDFCDRRFKSEQSLHQHSSNAYGHPYCIPCKQMFQSQSNLTQHMQSRTHVGSNMQCPSCKNRYVKASSVIIHLESGSCPSGMNHREIYEAIRRLDKNHVITNKLLTMPGYDVPKKIATERAWNGSFYECYFCAHQFRTLQALNSHLKSPAHEKNLYHCPKRSCSREYKLLSGLVQHMESESCGVMRFSQIQRQARNGIENMFGRMIKG